MKKTEFYLTTKEIHFLINLLSKVISKYNLQLSQRKLSFIQQDYLAEAKSLHNKLVEYELKRR